MKQRIEQYGNKVIGSGSHLGLKSRRMSETIGVCQRYLESGFHAVNGEIRCANKEMSARYAKNDEQKIQHGIQHIRNNGFKHMYRV